MAMKSWVTRQKIRKAKKRKKLKVERSVLRAQIFVGAALTCIIAALLAMLYFGTRTSGMQIVDVVAVGGNTIPHADVEALVQASLQGSYFRLVPKTFTWTFPKRAILQELQAVPRLKQADIVLDGQVVTVAFEEYRPVALWCDVDCYFLDRTGFAFAAAPVLTGSAFIRFSENDRVFTLKSEMLSSDFLATSLDLS